MHQGVERIMRARVIAMGARALGAHADKFLKREVLVREMVIMIIP